MLLTRISSKKGLANFWKDTSGNLAVLTSLMGLPLVLAAGFAVDHSRAEKEKAHIIAALDSAALAAVLPADLTADERVAYAKQVFYKNYIGEAKVQLEVNATREVVKITGRGEVATLTSGALGMNSLTIADTAQAELTRADVVCALALDPTGERAIEFLDDAKFSAPGCSVQANSTHNLAIVSDVVTPPIAKSFCTAGVSRGKFTPHIKHACTPVADPYAHLTPPRDGECSDLDKLNPGNVKKQVAGTLAGDISNGAILYPGTYCNGLKIIGTNVTFMPGTYIIKDKAFMMVAGSQATGDGVTIVLKGEKARMNILAGASANFTAPADGPFKGLVFYQTTESNPADANRGQSKNKMKIGKSQIGSSGGLVIVGTAYFPNHELVISSEQGVAARSPATSFIAYRLKFRGKSVTNIHVDHEQGGIPPMLPRSDEGARLVR